MSLPLIITNGGAAAEVIERTSIQASILTWDDVLHDGPVPAGMDFRELSFVRARFLSEWGWMSYRKIREKFAERDNRFLAAAGEQRALICWFEHDLYDQFQLWQILAKLASVRRENVWLICRERFIGPAAPEVLEEDFKERASVTDEQFRLASLLWDAFRDPAPERLLDLYLTEDHSALPFAGRTLRRWFQEYPAVEDGFSRTERTILDLLTGVDQPMPGGDLFRRYTATEEAAFMGDASFEIVLRRLATAPDAPLILQESAPGPDDDRPALARLIAQKRPDFRSHGPGKGIPGGERWMGGVHLQPGLTWYWSREQDSFVHDE